MNSKRGNGFAQIDNNPTTNIVLKLQMNMNKPTPDLILINNTCGSKHSESNILNK